MGIDLIWGVFGIPAPEREYRFHEKRKWRFDHCWPVEKIAVEIEGAIWSQGRHTRGKGFLGDMEKYNEAQLLGWRVFRFSPQQLKTGEAQAFVRRVLDKLKGEI